MTLYLDSADLEQARQAAALGFVHGCTTNPALLAEAGVRDPLPHIRQLAEIFEGKVFYQVLARKSPASIEEANTALSLAPNVGLKIAATVEGLRLATSLKGKGTLAITGIFTPAQAIVAAEAGAEFAIPYINRLTRFTGDGAAVVSQIAAALDGSATRLLVAGIKSPAEAVQARLAGAEHLSMPLNVILAMAENDLTQQAVEAFEAAWAKAKER
jgi:transaldolase